MKYLVLLILLIVSIANINTNVNIPKTGLRTQDSIITTSVETHLPDAPVITVAQHEVATTTTTVVPESTTTTTTIVTPVSTTAIVTPVSTTAIVTPVTPITTHEVSTLVELPIDYQHSITYYYPYFFKNHLITFVDEIDTSILVSTCSPGSNCAFCDPLNFEHCFKCDIGYFLNGFSCELFCPEGYVSDILRLKCVPVVTTITEIVYTKAYTFGSCNNMCGKAVSDCSCSVSCKQRGNCCSDYDSVNCDSIFLKASKVPENLCNLNSNCLYCDDLKRNGNIHKCNQCQDGYFLFDGRCYKDCPEGTVAETSNYTCMVRKESCLVTDCDECVKGNPSVCKTCERGHFLHNNMCHQLCPLGFRADRITWTCLEPPVFAWYWVYPSRTSCKLHCGVVIQEDWDCSCSADCFRYGNCCQDIEDVCGSLLFWRKAPTQRKNNFLKK